MSLCICLKQLNTQRNVIHVIKEINKNNIQTLAHDCKIDTEIVVKRLLILPETWCRTYSPHPHERYYELPLFVLIGG